MKKPIDNSSHLTYLLQGVLPDKLEKYIKISARGVMSESAESFGLERLETVAAILRGRLSVQSTRLRSLSKNNDSLLPPSFLETVAQRSTAVCRIARYFSLESFQNSLEAWIETVDDIRAENLVEVFHLDLEKILARNSDNDSQLAFQQEIYVSLKEMLTEMLDIPSNVAEKIFPKDYTQPFSSEDGGQPKKILISLLKALRKITVSQLTQINPIAIGTGFLVGDSHLMTNHHVVGEVEQARECVAQFNYVKNALGTNQGRIEYVLDPDLLFISNQKLDYTLVQLETDILKKKPGYSFNWIQLISNSASVLPGIDAHTRDKLCKHHKLPDSLQEIEGDRVFIIQHPGGEYQKIDLGSGHVLSYQDNGLLNHFLRYKAASDFGSSGAPVLNARGELIALHQAVMPSNPGQGKAEKLTYQGIRICHVIKDLQRRSVENLKLKSFIQDFVLTAEELDYPALPTAFELDGGDQSYIDLLGADSPSKQFEDPDEFTLEAWVHPYPQNTEGVIFSQLYREKWFDEVEQDAIFGQYVVALKVTADRQVLFERKPFWPVSSSNFPQNGLLYPLIQTDLEHTAKRHPFEVLALENNDDTDIIIHKNKEDRDKLKALKCILCCLGLIPLGRSDTFSIKEFSETISITDPSNDPVLVQAIKDFNGLRPSDPPSIQDEDGTIRISLAARDLFKRKGLFLGAGIKESGQNESAKFRDHFGPRVFELQKCLASLDWDYLSTECKRSSFDLEVPLHGTYDWPESYNAPETYQQHPNKTSTAVWKLQMSDFQSGRPIFGTLCLAALEKAKSYEVLTSQKLPIGQFSHVAVTYDQDTQEMYIYINGQVACRRYIGQTSRGYIQRTIIGADPVEASYRKQSTSKKLKAHYRGAISEPRLWKIKLSREDILSRMHSRLRYETSGADLIRYCRPEEDIALALSSPTTLRQETSASLSAISALGKQFKPQVKPLSPRLFPAPPIAVGLQISDVIPLQISPENFIQGPDTSGLTVELWVKPQCGNGAILKGTDAAGNTYLLSWANGKVRIALKFDSLTATVETQPLGLNAPIWHHIAFSWDANANSKEIRVYIDGKLKRLGVLAAQVESIRYRAEHRPFVKLAADRFETSSQTIEILPCEAEGPSDFCVLLAELRIWNLVRSQDRIVARLNQRLGQDPNGNKGLVGYWRFDDLADLPVTDDPKSVFPIPKTRELHFLDLGADHDWAIEKLKQLYSLGLFNSFLIDDCLIDSVLFRPNHKMKRQELAGLLINAFGGRFNEQRASMIAEFQDIEDSQYSSDIEYAWKLGMISGDAEDNALPDDNQARLSRKFIREIIFKPDLWLDRSTVAVSLLAALRDSKRNSKRNIKGNSLRLTGAKTNQLRELKILVSQAPKSEITDLGAFLAEEATRIEIAMMLYQTLTHLDDTLKPLDDENHVL
ncbi:LamG-like jellyroll fold domain-containing protein [cf. Phormidesmis sp. LEGE 11477]|uniref:LamG-like jellyroll fold domain-containing protein n=1 Tax=cf. Phormidesmis sp. LEGE 11477 TaxID=1828680 RepID=UPI00187FA7AC|nr:LamG-like jellyroll fold domain-containing protein [cf. Phormidesmis sp. LEGE 11477]MBE9063693.1 trypsin-like peptidase domain-containing protein [cf. Phormidesmis sp. LEGE 11477]